MPGLLDINTPGGQQILYDFVNWRVSGRKPVTPISNTFWNSRPSLYHVLTEKAFLDAAKKIAPVALGKMSNLEFNLLLGTLEGRNNKELWAQLCKEREENPCDGSKIQPPFPYTKEDFKRLHVSDKEPSIAPLNRYTFAGRRLLMDFVDSNEKLFHPTIEVGNVHQWRHRPEYQKVTRSVFQSAALKIAKDVAYHVPDEVRMSEIFDEVRQDLNQKAKLRSNKLNTD